MGRLGLAARLLLVGAVGLYRHRKLSGNINRIDALARRPPAPSRSPAADATCS